jgi:endo-1,4-beta-xylanase
MRIIYTNFRNYFHCILIAVGIVAMISSGFQLDAQMAQNKCKFLGNIIGSSVPADFATYWNQVTPENAGKWGSVEKTRDNMTWDGLDMAYNYAKDKGFPFKHHNFVWGQQQPGWITGFSQEEQKDEVEEWIRLYGEKYPETDFIDVVNEPLHAPPAYKDALGGNGTTGWDWVIWTFKKARYYCPNAKLLLNDYGIINSNTATDQYLEIIYLLKDSGLIDGIGEQGFENADNGNLHANLDKLAATGLPIYISEYDVNIASDDEQLAIYMKQFPIFWENPAVKGITLWGYIQGKIWKTNAYLIRTDGTVRPALTWLESYISNSNAVTCLPESIHHETNEESAVTIYPNPAHNRNITINNTQGITQIRIIDSFGTIIKELAVHDEETINIEVNAVPGLYLIIINDNQNSVFRKVIFI